MQNNWVDFKAVKAAVTMEMVLGRYGVNWLRKNGEELRGRCPIHHGEGQSTFHASLTKNAFNCFSCKARGNVLDFVAAMEKCSVRDAGAKLMEWFSISATQEADGKKTTAKEERGAEPAAVNKPLAFQLKGIDHEHPYLKTRGITPETAQTFGVGYFSGKGSMSGRIVIPIHDESGELVAYAGRAIDDSEPRYKLPKGFHKSQVVYNLHRVGESDHVVVVEGFFDCMKVAQAGFPAVALMGSSLAEQQEHLLLRQFKKVTLMLDGDTAGRGAAETIAEQLVHKIHVRIVDLSDRKQPDHLTAEEANQLLA
jgi:DNA primase